MPVIVLTTAGSRWVLILPQKRRMRRAIVPSFEIPATLPDLVLIDCTWFVEVLKYEVRCF